MTPREYDAVRAALMRARTKDRRAARELGAVEAVDSYFNLHEPGWAFRLNERLRRGDATDPSVHLLDAALGASSTTAPSILFRGMNLSPRWRVGSRVSFSAFLSTSFLPLQALFYARAGTDAMVMRLHVPSDVGHLPALFAPREDELMLPRGTRWEVVGHRPDFRVPRSWAVHPKHGDHWDVVPHKVALWDLVLKM